MTYPQQFGNHDEIDSKKSRSSFLASLTLLQLSSQLLTFANMFKYCCICVLPIAVVHIIHI